MSLYEDLSSSSVQQRAEVAEQLVTGMRGPDTDTNRAFWQLCQQVIEFEQAQETAADAELPGWEFTADNSALLVARHPRRVRGFLNAIAGAPQATSVIDAGCGSSALLSVAAAVTHPRSEVIAYEINGPAARCARQIIGLMGLSDRISVEEADVLAAGLPSVDLGITETFAIGLLTEQGHRIAAKLAGSAKEVLPASSVIYACDERPDATTFWQKAASVDFAVDNELVSGSLRAKSTGTREVHAYAGFFDARQGPIVTETGTNLANPVCLGDVQVSRPDSHIAFSYRLGSELHESPASLHAA